MERKNPENRSQEQDELERKVRSERKFSLFEAIGRLGGSGIMKGTSPVTCKQQAEAAIKDYVDRHLADSESALRTALLRQVSQSEILLTNLDQPLVVLASHLQRILNSQYLLDELVREADVEWGRLYGERPHFERPAAKPDPDDPYTTESVLARLTGLLDSLKDAGTVG